MTKGVSIKFKSYQETVSKLLELIKLSQELQKHKKIILKPSLKNSNSSVTSPDFVEAVLKFCLKHKTPETEVFIAEGSDGEETMEVFKNRKYTNLAEKYSIGLVDLNNTELQEIRDGEFLRFSEINYPKILLESFIISLPRLAEDSETEIQGSLSNMLGVFPAYYYSGIFSKNKTKIRKWNIKYSIHDILKCKMPQLAIIDASEKGFILAGLPLSMDIQAAKLLGKDWRSISHLRLAHESFSEPKKKTEELQIIQ
ncbi:MAG: DUF362 domain-containing protein [Nanoarchaeota archaeon]